MTGSDSEITLLIRQWQEGHPEAADQLIECVYPELKKIAKAMLKNERREHTLTATALVNELYLKLVRSCHLSVQNRTQFFALAAHSLRHILVDYARAHGARKRGGNVVRITLDPATFGVGSKKFEDLLSVDVALTQLEELDTRAAQVVELRFFAGLSEEEVAQVMGLSTNTVQRDWKAARAWLTKQLTTKGPKERSARA